MDPLTFMLTREARRYETDLRAWAQQVAMARTAEDAIRAAHRKPAPGGLIRGLRYLYAGEQQRQMVAVERELLAKLERLTDAAEIARCVRLAAGLAGLPAAQRWARTHRTAS